MPKKKLPNGPESLKMGARTLTLLRFLKTNASINMSDFVSKSVADRANDIYPELVKKFETIYGKEEA